VPCGLARGTPPPPDRPWIPKDEYLCDGGDHLEPVHFGGEGFLRGIDPRDAVLRFQRPSLEQLAPEFERLRQRFEGGEITRGQFDIESRRLFRSAAVGADIRPRLLPTNMVCLYAPRFAAVRASVGPNQNLTVQYLRGLETLEAQQTHHLATGPRRLVQNNSAELNRAHTRASGMIGRVFAGAHAEVRVLGSADTVTHIKGHIALQGSDITRNRQKAAEARGRVFLQGIKTAEGPVVTGIIQGAGEQVMAWKPQELAGLEVPPNRPGLAVIKRVSAAEAEPGDVITFSIQYRNMGNVPISSVSVVDSLIPRFEYVPGSARGPAGTVFTAGENKAGSMELRWDLPGVIPPGGEGYVSFEVKVR
ncbi:MAG: DUF11 domain-containing protein, partial [Isosphaeraceae bacterium]|nr:DUF11 domain-containing protein [Isosphaeraceae bacterium]